MKRFYRLLLCLAAALLTTCHPSDPLPAETQTGKNTLACKISGKTYISDGGRGFMPDKPVYGGSPLYTTLRDWACTSVLTQRTSNALSYI